MKYAWLLPIIMIAGCATSYVDVTQDDMKIRVARNSIFRRGPYKFDVNMPVENDKVLNIKVSGNDDGMSTNLTLLGAVVGAAIAGPPGAAVGGGVGGIMDITDKLVEDKKAVPESGTNVPK
jgi:hypothetical protein